MTVLYHPKFDYQPLLQINSPSGRTYETPDGVRLPSVTTILSKVPDPEKMEGLRKWRQFVGNEKANTILRESSNIGTFIHSHLEKHIKGELRPAGNNIIRKQATDLSQIIIDRGMPHVSEIWGTEVPLHYPDLYAGTTDCVGVYKGRESIIDFKNSRKPKTITQVKDYWCQISAYILAHNKVYNTNIDCAVIMLIVRGDPDPKQFGIYQEFVLEGAELQHYKELWGKKVEAYYNLIS